MKSRVTIDVDEDNHPVLKLEHIPTEDVRDKLAKRFIEGFGSASGWARVTWLMHAPDVPGINNTVIVRPIKPEEMRQQSGEMSGMYELWARDNTKTKSVELELEDTKDFNNLPSRFQIGNEVDYTTDKWTEEGFQKAKLVAPHTKDEDIEYVPRYSYGRVVAVRFTEAKVYYDVMDILSNEIHRDLISNHVKRFSEEVRENLKAFNK